MKVYIVQGSTGEWDDYCEWAVCVCATEEIAERKIKELKDLMKEIKPNRYDYESIKKMRSHEKGDPKFNIDDSTDYEYYAVDFLQ